MEVRNTRFVTNGIQLVCRTFASDPQGSAALIRRCLTPERIAEYGYIEIPWIARCVDGLLDHDTKLVSDIYVAALSHREASGEATALGSSQIMGFRSNRRQDYESAAYELAKAFPKFLAKAPTLALPGLVAAMESRYAERNTSKSGKDLEFNWNGTVSRYRADGSEGWDRGLQRVSDDFNMKQQFETYLGTLAGDGGRIAELREVVLCLSRCNRLAGLWRIVLRVGTQFPSTLGKEVAPLVCALPVLVSTDTSTLAGEFLKVAFEHFDPKVREAVEREILSIPEVPEFKGRQLASYFRDRLLGCLSNAHLMTAEAKAILAAMHQSASVPENKLREPIAVVRREITEEDILSELGLTDEEIDLDVNKSLRAVEAPVSKFNEKHLNSSPTVEECKALLPSLQEKHQSDQLIYQTTLNHAT